MKGPRNFRLLVNLTSCCPRWLGAFSAEWHFHEGRSYNIRRFSGLQAWVSLAIWHPGHAEWSKNTFFLVIRDNFTGLSSITRQTVEDLKVLVDHPSDKIESSSDAKNVKWQLVFCRSPAGQPQRLTFSVNVPFSPSKEFVTFLLS